MIAAVLEQFQEPLQMREVEEPGPVDGRVLVEVRAAGLCRTDLKITSGEFGRPPLPLVLGHEVAGVVVSGGAALPVGTRVACRGLENCQKCSRCMAGEETVCLNPSFMGLHRPGGFAQYVSVAERAALPIPDHISFESAAVTMDSVVATWRALVTRAGVSSGDRVLVAGVGGLGLAAVQVAVAQGALVAVIDPVADHREAAIETGAQLAQHPDELEELTDWAGPGIDIGVETSGARQAFDVLTRLVRPGGTIVSNGYRPGVEYGLDSAELVLKEISVVGSRHGTLADAQQALAAVATGRVTPRVSRALPLTHINEAFDLLRRDQVVGRMVVTP